MICRPLEPSPPPLSLLPSPTMHRCWHHLHHIIVLVVAITTVNYSAISIIVVTSSASDLLINTTITPIATHSITASTIPIASTIAKTSTSHLLINIPIATIFTHAGPMLTLEGAVRSPDFFFVKHNLF